MNLQEERVRIHSKSDAIVIAHHHSLLTLDIHVVRVCVHRTHILSLDQVSVRISIVVSSGSQNHAGNLHHAGHRNLHLAAVLGR